MSITAKTFKKSADPIFEGDFLDNELNIIKME